MNKQLKRLGIGHTEDEIEERNFVLDNPSPINDGNELATYQLLGEIGIFIIGCYDFELNPLRFLRAIYPSYEWKFWRGPGDKDIEKLVMTSDYFWSADKYGWSAWVTAHKKNSGAPRRIFGNGFIDDMLEDDSYLQKILKSCGVQEVWPDYMKGCSNTLFV